MTMTMTMMLNAREVHIARRKHFMCLSMGPGVGVGVGEVQRAYIGQSWSTTARFFVFARNPSLALMHHCHLSMGPVQERSREHKLDKGALSCWSFYGQRSHHVFFLYHVSCHQGIYLSCRGK